MTKQALILCVVIGLGACANYATKWEHPEIPPAEWSLDGAQCRYDARRQAERENNQVSEAEINLYGDEIDTIGTMIMSSGIKNRSRELFDQCMEGLGYVHVE